MTFIDNNVKNSEKEYSNSEIGPSCPNLQKILTRLREAAVNLLNLECRALKWFRFGFFSASIMVDTKHQYNWFMHPWSMLTNRDPAKSYLHHLAAKIQLKKQKPADIIYSLAEWDSISTLLKEEVVVA